MYGRLIRIEFGCATNGSQFTLDIKVVSECSSSTSALQENMLYSSVNTISVTTTSAYTAKAQGLQMC